MKQVISVLVLVAALSGSSFAENETSTTDSSSDRVIGGSNAAIKNYPFMLLLFLNTVPTCGASVIGQTYALTAAQCLYKKTINSIVFRGGSDYLNSGGTAFTGRNWFIHPAFNPSTLDNDAAVVLTTPFTTNPMIRPISLQYAEPAASTACYVLGWGYRSPTGPAAPSLQLGEYSLQSQLYCNSAIPGRFTSQMYCATTTRGRACVGDIGGPLVCGGRLHGIVSFYVNRCEANRVEGFTKIPSASIRDFIRRVSGI